MVENVAIVAAIPRSCKSVMRSAGFGVKRPEHMAAVDVEIGRSLVRMGMRYRSGQPDSMDVVHR